MTTHRTPNRCRPRGGDDRTLLRLAVLAGAVVLLAACGSSPQASPDPWGQWTTPPTTPTANLPTAAPPDARPTQEPADVPSARVLPPTLAPAPLPAPLPAAVGRHDATQFGLGDVSPGASVAQAEQQLNVSYDDVPLTDGECAVLFDWSAGLGVITAPSGTVQVHVVQSPDVFTVEGVGVGSTWAELAAAYPDWISESAYVPDEGGRYALVSPAPYGTAFDSSGRGRGMFFEVDEQDRVVEYRVGAMPYVHLINYCSMPD